eukprot:scaffold4743_cov171-Amphora_coffeaeformis.AAC.22
MNSSPATTVPVLGSVSVQEGEAKQKSGADTSTPSEDDNHQDEKSATTGKTTARPRRPSLLTATRGMDDSPLIVQLTAKIGRSLVQRYGPYVPKPALASRLQALSSEQRGTFEQLKAVNEGWNEELLFRVASFVEFDEEAALQLLSRMKLARWNNLKAEQLATEFSGRSIVPLPRIYTKSTTDIVYIHPSVFPLSCDPLRLLIYTLMCLGERHGEDSCKPGLLFNMQDYRFSFEQMASFSLDDWISLMRLMQGEEGPIQVSDVLWVNCSVDFLKVWKNTLRPQCARDFKWRISLVSEDAQNLHHYLNEGHETSLPTEFSQGQATVSDLSNDFQQYRRALEEVLSQQNLEKEEEISVEVPSNKDGLERNCQANEASLATNKGETNGKPENEGSVTDEPVVNNDTATEIKEVVNENNESKTKGNFTSKEKEGQDEALVSKACATCSTKNNRTVPKKEAMNQPKECESDDQDLLIECENTKPSDEFVGDNYKVVEVAQVPVPTPGAVHVSTVKESNAVDHLAKREAKESGIGGSDDGSDEYSIDNNDESTTYKAEVKFGGEVVQRRLEVVKETGRNTTHYDMSKIPSNGSEQERESPASNNDLGTENQTVAAEEAGNEAGEVISASSKATAVILQYGRSMTKATQDTEKAQPVALGDMKSMWKVLRTRVSESGSPIEVELSASIGQSLVQRYGPFPPKPTLASRLEDLTTDQQRAYGEIKTTWKEEWEVIHPGEQQPWSDRTIIRVASFAEFEVEEALELLRRMPITHWQNSANIVDAGTLAEDAQTLSIVPLPGVTTRAAKDTVYVYPKRFTAACNPLRLLTYTMNCMYDRHRDSESRCKLALLMNLNGYRFSSKQLEAFPLKDWVTWMELIQGQNGPLRVVQVLLVNASPEFLKVWKAKLRQHCEDGFSWRFNLVEDADHLDRHLKPGFEENLPKDLPRGKARVKDLVGDFMKYRKALESIVQERERVAEEKRLKLENIDAVESNSDDDAESGLDIPTNSAHSVNRRKMMGRNPSTSDLTGAKRSTKAPLRKYASKRTLTADSSSTPTGDHREMLDRSTSVQTMQSQNSSQNVPEQESTDSVIDRRRMLHRTNSVQTKSSTAAMAVHKEASTEHRRTLHRTNSVQAMGSVSRRRHIIKATSTRELKKEKSNNDVTKLVKLSESSNKEGKAEKTNDDLGEETQHEPQKKGRGNDDGQGQEGSTSQTQDLNDEKCEADDHEAQSASLPDNAPTSVNSDEANNNDNRIQNPEPLKLANSAREEAHCSDSDDSNENQEIGAGNRNAQEAVPCDSLSTMKISTGVHQDKSETLAGDVAVGESKEEEAHVLNAAENVREEKDDLSLKGEGEISTLPDNSEALQVISTSSKAATILLQRGRSVSKNNDTAEKLQPKPTLLSGLAAKKNMWKALRTKVSEAASPVEVQLAVRIGDALAKQYGPYPPKSTLETRLENLKPKERSAFANIQETWEEEWVLLHRKEPQPWNEEVIFRASVFADFALEESMELLRRMSPRHWQNSVHTVSSSRLSDDFDSLAVVPLPGITTKAAKDVVYVCPKRFTAESHPLRLLTYAMNCMHDRHGDTPSKCKLALLMNMSGYRFSSKQQQAFSLQDWISWMELIQGQNGPIKASQVLFVNAAKEFKLVFRAKLREHCQDGFSWRFSVIDDESTLDKYLTPGFEPYLPSDFPQGQADIKGLVKKFLTYREALETILTEQDGVYQQKKKERREKNDEASDAEESSHEVKPSRRVNRRPMMSRHSSMSSMNTSKRSLHVPRRKFNVGDGPAAPSPVVDRRQMLHRSNSVQTMRSPDGLYRRDEMPRTSTSRRLQASGANNDADDAPDPLMDSQHSPNFPSQTDDEEGMLQHLQRRQNLSMNSSSHHGSSLGSSRHREPARPRFDRGTSRRHLLHRSNSAQNLS